MIDAWFVAVISKQFNSAVQDIYINAIVKTDFSLLVVKGLRWIICYSDICS